jgi:hypothetical protein
MAKKQCAVNRNADGQITSVDVQNLDNAVTEESYSLQDYLATPVETDLYNKVQTNPSLYETAADNYINSKVSMNQVMRDIGVNSKIEFFDILAELGIPIKISLTEQQYNDIKTDIANGATKKELSGKYKIGSIYYKYLTQDANVELIDKKETRPTLRIKELAPEIISSILADRVAGMSIYEVYHKYDIPLARLNRLFKKNNLGDLRSESAARNQYVGKRGIPFQSEKIGAWITADSEYEIARFLELEVDPNVLTYSRDIDPVTYNDGVKNRKYFPDIKVTYTDGRVEIEEVKPFFIISKGEMLDQLRRENASMEEIREILNVSDSMFNIISNTQLKMNTAKEFYENQGITYKIMTENEINTKLSDYSSITKSSKREEYNKRKREQYLEMKEKRILPSKLYDELKEQPFINEEQALDAYKNIYSDDLNEWKDSDLDC